MSAMLGEPGGLIATMIVVLWCSGPLLLLAAIEHGDARKVGEE